MTTSRNWTKRLAARGAVFGVAALLATGGLFAPVPAEARGLNPAGAEALGGIEPDRSLHQVNGRHGKYGRGRHYRRDRGYRRGHRYKHKPRRYRHHHGPRVRYVYRRHDRGHDELGAAIAGFALGIVTYHVLDTDPPPPPATTYRWTTPPRIVGVGQPAVTTQGPPSACRMTREYQTRVMIGGRERDAYGTACLQADGSWRLGPPTIL